MNKLMKKALVKYGRTIREHGWKEGEALVDAGEKKFKDFRKWAKALGIVLRAKELIAEARETVE